MKPCLFHLDDLFSIFGLATEDQTPEISAIALSLLTFPLQHNFLLNLGVNA
jgi:hypothetical protein